MADVSSTASMAKFMSPAQLQADVQTSFTHKTPDIQESKAQQLIRRVTGCRLPVRRACSLVDTSA